jgi:hypothetical protein
VAFIVTVLTLALNKFNKGKAVGECDYQEAGNFLKTRELE